MDNLRFHGDQELGAGLVDFAVNIYRGPRPLWLSEALTNSLNIIDQYPNYTAATNALAAYHQVSTENLIVTAGAAEAFTLIARLQPWQYPVVVHPQFTEPDTALREAGRQPHHVFTDSTGQFSPEVVPEEADLVFIGNPTNPTGVLHRADLLTALLRPGRIVVVDEAFMDFVPTMTESLVAQPQSGLIVLRSLTKMWSVPGIRAGYLTTDEVTARKLREKQTPWSVSSPALAVLTATATSAADEVRVSRALEIAQYRADFTEALIAINLPPCCLSSAPFVLVTPHRNIHQQLRDFGFATRRADTFPGLSAPDLRLTVRSPEISATLVSALAALLS